eukprot:g3314.t1
MECERDDHEEELQELHDKNKRSKKNIATVNLHRAVERWRHMNLSHGWNSWIVYMELQEIELERQEHLENVNALKHANKNSKKEFAIVMLHRAMERWRHLNMSHGWNSWMLFIEEQELTEERRVAKVKAMTYIVSGMLHGQLHRAMRKWESYVQIHNHFQELQALRDENQLQVEEREVQRRKEKVKAMTFIVKGMLHGKLHHALRKWQTYVQVHNHFQELQVLRDESKRTEKDLAIVMLHRAMERWRHLNMSHGWNSWMLFIEEQELTEERRVAKVKAMTYIVSGMLHGQLHRAMRKWESYVQIHNHFQELQALRDENQLQVEEREVQRRKEKVKAMTFIVKGMLHGKLHRALRKWQTYVQIHNHFDELKSLRKEYEASNSSVVEKCRVALLKAADAHERHVKREKESNRMIRKMSEQMKDMSDEIRRLNLDREKMTRVLEEKEMEIQTKLEEERSRASSLEIETRILRNELRSVESVLPSLKQAADRASRAEKDRITSDVMTSFRERKMEQEIQMLRTQLLESEGENERLRKRLHESETRSRELVRDMETRYLDCRSDLWRASLSSASKPSPPPVPPHIGNESIDFEEFDSVQESESDLLLIKSNALDNVATKLFYSVTK